MGCRVEDGLLFVLGLWEAPLDDDGSWEVPVTEVDAAVARAFDEFNVQRMYCDPAYWQDIVGRWSSEHGEKHVIEWWTNRERAMVSALERFHTATITGQLSHDGNEDLARHIGNAHRKETRSGVAIRKDRPKSPRKIDLAMAAVLAYEARGDVVQAGLTKKKKKPVMAGF